MNLSHHHKYWPDDELIWNRWLIAAGVFSQRLEPTMSPAHKHRQADKHRERLGIQRGNKWKKNLMKISDGSDQVRSPPPNKE